MRKRKIIILDFAFGEVHVFDYDENVYEDFEDFYAHMEEEGYNFSDSNCQCMVVDELKIQIN